MMIESIIFYILLFDSTFAVLMAFRGGRAWWQGHLGKFANLFPLAKGWVVYYWLLVIFIGWLLHSHSSLITPF